jgi:PAS domain S-box-containing protein/putative nucleotidyltransferase with HDIG domain
MDTALQSQRHLRVLCLEDSLTDAELVGRELSADGYDLEMDVATERGHFEELLAGDPYDVILADYRLPGFDAHAALKLATAACPQTPFVCVSTAIAEEVTVELLKGSAVDLVLEDRMARLPFAVQRAIDEAAHRQTLRKSEKRYAQLFDNMIEGFVYCRMLDDEEGHPDDFVFLSVNPAFARLAGLDNDVVGKLLRETLPMVTDETAKLFDIFCKVAQSGAATEFEIDFRPLDLRLLVSAFCPEPDHCAAMFSDITARVQAQAALRASEERLALTLEATRDGTWDWDVRSGNTVFSPRYYAMLGYEPDDFSQTHDAFTGLLHPEDVERVQRDIRQTLDAGRGFEIEFRMRTKSGEWCWVLGRSQTVERDAKGRALRVVGAISDISERKRAEEELRSSEAILATVESVAELGSWRWDLGTQRVDWSKGMFRLFAVDPAGFDGDVTKALSERVHPDDLAALQEATASMLESEELVPGEYRFLLPDGSERIVYGAGRAERNAAGEVVAVVGYYQDITEDKSAEASLRESAERYRSLFESAHSVMLLLDAQSGEIVDANPAACAWYGWSRAEMLAMHVGQINTLPKPQIQAVLEKAVASGGGVFLFKHRLADGTVRDVEAHVEPLKVQGRSLLYSLIYDVTDRRQAELQLHNSIAKQQQIAEGVVAALSRSVEVRDPYTAGHQHHVSELAVAIAGELGLAEERVRHVQVAGMLHDVGKIIVPAEILVKPGRLSDMEFALIKEHSQAAYEILRPIEFDFPLAEIAVQHHERLDGSGYPAGLAGDEILLEARILAVADVVEAMISDRPYRAALPLDAALAEIEEGAGSRYDAAVCGPAVRLFREQGFTLSADASRDAE